MTSVTCEVRFVVVVPGGAGTTKNCVREDDVVLEMVDLVLVGTCTLLVRVRLSLKWIDSDNREAVVECDGAVKDR